MIQVWKTAYVLGLKQENVMIDGNMRQKRNIVEECDFHVIVFSLSYFDSIAQPPSICERPHVPCSNKASCYSNFISNCDFAILLVPTMTSFLRRSFAL